MNAETVFTAHLATLLKSMALGGRGVAWLPRALISNELRDQHQVSAGGAAWTVPVEIRLFRRRMRERPWPSGFGMRCVLRVRAAGPHIIALTLPVVSAVLLDL